MIIFIIISFWLLFGSVGPKDAAVYILRTKLMW